MKTIYLIFICLLPFGAKAQIITTVAGGGTVIGDGGPATAADLGGPNTGAFDAYGNYYYAAITQERIRKIDPLGIITTVVGTGVSGYSGNGGPATAAKLYEPCSNTFDKKGNMYFCQTGNSVVSKVDMITGIITTVAGNGTMGFSGDGGPATSAQMSDIQDVCVDKFGNLYIADSRNYRIRKVDTFGIISTVAGNGTYITSAFGVPATSTGLVFPSCVVTDDTGNVYIGNERVLKIDRSGILRNVVGNGMWAYSGEGIPATNAQLIPIKIRFDKYWNLFIVDRHNQRVYRVDATGIFHLEAGNGVYGSAGDNGPATAAELKGVTGITFDQCDNLYITQVDNNRIRKITYPHCNYLSAENEHIFIQSISIYPNPANDELHIDNLQSKTNYSILNTIGQTTQQGTFKAGNSTISIQALPNGIYMLELTDETGRRTVSKVVKQ